MAIKISGTEVIDNSRSIVNARDGIFSGFVSASSFGGSGIVPEGLIAMWYGSIANIPTGWLLCDGTKGTPDLRNRFIVGAHSGAGVGFTPTSGPGFDGTTGALNANYTPGNRGGRTAHKLTVAEMPAHDHLDNTAVPSRSTSGGGARDGADGRTTRTGSTGGDKYHENRPPYYALAFIMRATGGIFIPT